ncbi:hypothetical protein [Acinetobacter variabilis]|uniref:hypothetical protein n=1 Tax=Acinetobacter variabilis TaxID=70346 RepID=UPI0028A140BE|nr:hypothetical protein [Acinetobacter variabilis]
MRNNEKPSDEALSDITLEALVRLLYLRGVDLDEIQRDYSSRIADNYLAGSHYKNATPQHLARIIEDTKKNSVLINMRQSSS